MSSAVIVQTVTAKVVFADTGPEYAAADYVIEANNVCAGYGRENILHDVTLRIKRGSITGFCGPNGAGKSTFLKLCLGLVRLNSGSISVFGMKTSGFASRALRLRTGYVPQNTKGGQLPTTVREAVSMGLYGKAGFFRGLSKKEREQVDCAMEAAGVNHLQTKAVQELSGGQTQRVAIARALAQEAELLLLDEPTSNLDAQGREELLHIIKERREYKHITAVLVSHTQDDFLDCENIYQFKNGRAVHL